MIYLKWTFLAAIDIAFLLVSFPLAPLFSLFTQNGWPKWMALFATYDNPPQGDSGYQKKRAPFCPASTPFQLYVNRVFWMWRNPCYGLQKLLGVKHGSEIKVYLVRFGGSGVDASDKYKKPGWYYAKCSDKFDEVIAFEFYAVLPWSESRCFRIRLGWKIVTDKFERLGFAPLVDTFNPLDGYGNS